MTKIAGSGLISQRREIRIRTKMSRIRKTCLKDNIKSRDMGWMFFFIAAGTLYITTTHLIFVSPEEKVSTSGLHFRFALPVF
jgi:hypothetical protein